MIRRAGLVRGRPDRRTEQFEEPGSTGNAPVGEEDVAEGGSRRKKLLSSQEELEYADLSTTDDALGFLRRPLRGCAPS